MKRNTQQWNKQTIEANIAEIKKKIKERSGEDSLSVYLTGNMSEGFSMSNDNIWLNGWSFKTQYVALTGWKNALFAEPDLPTDSISDPPYLGRRLAVLGDNSLIAAGDESTTCLLGGEGDGESQNSFIEIGGFSSDSENNTPFKNCYSFSMSGYIATNPPMLNSVLVSIGALSHRSSEIRLYGGGENNILLSTGKDTKLYDGTVDYATYESKNNQFISTGLNTCIQCKDNNVVYSSGEEANISVGNNNVIFSGGEGSEIVAGVNTILFLVKKPDYFSVGSNSTVAIVWNDGTRDRIMVLYAGEGGIESGKHYKVSRRGEVFEVDPPS